MGYYITRMKDKIITIKPKGISQKQWSIFLLELNLMKKAWKRYGVEVQMSAPGLKRILDWGTKRYGTDPSE
tara:strand:+ start:44 stop:256 length:213 start_codon:yes stop_codon:yes gene_type:complete